ncbi:hypothetical protein L228DRAFT_269535 [Xylona heveae TC161]|uniref:Uncharacterized protein n=1 Tax=Xylona heveae (strain CBS 132557 / TC161) TaxID=1328760 RepID=A0A165FLZ3_XYLHT|nr:hypothetical protein L228DRAFT_269535 [Xylona heveae TC161]KZF21136.1 hypothetical protein L228DRAFT_269535 [Xylona heveae TC161]
MAFLPRRPSPFPTADLQVAQEPTRSSFGVQQSAEQNDTGADNPLGSSSVYSEQATPRLSSKRRSLSDAGSSFSTSPKLQETLRSFKDDQTIKPTPGTPSRSVAHGLSLQLPRRDITGLNATNLINKVPLSPKLDASNSYGVPASTLPRRSRGLDFSRACTNLHHSTLAEQSSPDSSPTMAGKGMMIPSRKGLHHTQRAHDSPSNGSTSHWSTISHSERKGIPSSVGSVNMLDSDPSSSSSDEDDFVDLDDAEDTTYAASRPSNVGGSINSLNGYQIPPIPSGLGNDILGSRSPMAANFMSFQRARLRSRKGSSSANSILGSPSPRSPSLVRSIETVNGGYFAKDLARKDIEARRESLSLGTKDLHISSGGESDECMRSVGANDGVTPAALGKDERRGVIKRTVTRRGSLLPKTKTFARVRAALLEEGAPVDSDVRREAEVVRQVRESEPDLEPSFHTSQSSDAARDVSPSLLPVVPGFHDLLEDIPEDNNMNSEATTSTIDPNARGSFSRQAMKNSGGLEFWNSFDERMHTPPPPSFPRGASSGASEDVNMDSPSVSTPPSSSILASAVAQMKQSSRASTPQPFGNPSITEVPRKANKRARDDELDSTSLKRRAVSPGMSVQNSPILTQSPAQKDSSWWGLARANREPTPASSIGAAPGERANSGSSASSGVTATSMKRVGLQGMNDTNDGIMKMSIE